MLALEMKCIRTYLYVNLNHPLASSILVTCCVCGLLSFYNSVHRCYDCPCRFVVFWSAECVFYETSNYWLTSVRCVGLWLTGVTVGNWSASRRRLQLTGCPDNMRIYTEAGLTCDAGEEFVLSHLLTRLHWPSLYAVWWLLDVGDLCWSSLLGADVSCLKCNLCFSCCSCR